MFKINNWKEPIDKYDLLYVILNGLISAILCGILAGSLNFLLIMINMPFDIGYIILFMIIPWRIKNSFENNHILYAVIGLIALFLGFLISSFTTIVISYAVAGINPLFLLGEGSLYFDIIFEPFLNIINAFGYLTSTGDIAYGLLKVILSILSLLLLIYAFYYTYITIRRKR